MKQFFALTMALVLATACGIFGQTPEERRQIADEVQQKLDERSFEIDINYMIPLRGTGKAVNSYSVSVKDNVLDSHLPYFGVARDLPYGGGKGLTFTEKISAYSDSGLVGDRREIVVTVANGEDIYVYTITVFDNGSADVHVHSRNRDDISYRGSLR